MRRRGLTLAEVMVAGALLLLTAAVAYACALLTARSQMKAGDRVTAEVNAIVGLESVRLDMQNSSLSSLVIGSNRISFLTARDSNGLFQTDASGAPQWQATVVYYDDDAQGVLRRRRIAYDQGPLSPQQLSQACNGSGTLVAYGARSLSASLNGSTVRLELTCRGSRPADQETLAATFEVRQP